MRTTTPLLVRGLGWTLVLAAAGCGGDAGVPFSDEDGGTAVAGPSTTTSGSGPSATTTEAADGSSAEGLGSGFLQPRDYGSSPFQCDLFAQDCPAGHKCMPWANDGGAWNATRCSPIADEPAAKGESCRVEGSQTSGIDDCELGAMCWDIDHETNEGVCVDLCMGSDQAPFCEDPDEHCSIGGDGAVVLCLPTCNPLGQDCPEGQACYPILEHWSCGPDASGELGAYGDPCEFITKCDPGLICLDSSTVPPGQPCEGAGGCCTEVCDLDDPLGDAQCAGAAEGQTCLPWYEEDQAPPGYEDVGACAVPQ